MIIVLKPRATQGDIDSLILQLEKHGLQAHLSVGAQRTIVGIVGDKSKLDTEQLSVLPYVDKLVPIVEPYKLANRQFHPEDTCFTIKGVTFGGPELIMMAGPCAVESYEQLRGAAVAIKQAGAKVLRGGAYKPRTSPYSFQGLENEGFRMLREVADELGLLVISEVTSELDLEEAMKYVDIVQVGARNSQNFRLLRAIGQADIPVMLKRGIAEMIEELLSSTEYILSEGNEKLILCERGIRTFETATRNTLDVAAVPVLQEKTHLPIFVDPSHAAGKAGLVTPLALSAVAAGADGLIVEVHPDPSCAMSDAAQQLTPDVFAALAQKVSAMAQLLGRSYNVEVSCL